jgi:hypothetical protein
MRALVAAVRHQLGVVLVLALPVSGYGRVWFVVHLCAGGRARTTRAILHPCRIQITDPVRAHVRQNGRPWCVAVHWIAGRINRPASRGGRRPVAIGVDGDPEPEPV